MASNAKAEILAAIGKTDDANMKTVLLLLLTVLDEIGNKIDALRSDEQGLREAVLNGHSAVHDSHHEWIAKRVAAGECETTCQWVRERIAQEKEDAASEKDSKRKIRDALIERIIWAAVLLVAGSGWWLR